MIFQRFVELWKIIITWENLKENLVQIAFNRRFVNRITNVKNSTDMKIYQIYRKLTDRWKKCKKKNFFQSPTTFVNSLSTLKIITNKMEKPQKLHIIQLWFFFRKLVIFYTEIFTRKVYLWCFFMSEKIHNSTFLVKMSV